MAPPTQLRIHTPSAPLSRYIDYLWFQEAPPGAHERIVPSGTTELVVALHDRPLCLGDNGHDAPKPVGSAVLCGTHAGPFVIETHADDRLIGVHFRPGGAFPFFAPPAGELHGTRLVLDDLWGRAAATLRERLAAAPTVDAQFALLEEALLAQAGRPLQRHPAVAHALGALEAAADVVTIAALVKETGLSARRFIELFRREVGLSPKLFAQVRRLQRVLGRLEDPAGASWTEVALDHGYFDQPHLVRDFQRFAGLSPRAYLARPGAAMNHVTLPDRG